MLSGVNLVHVPYRGGGPALVDLLGGQVQVMFVGISESIEHIKTGRLGFGRAMPICPASCSRLARNAGDFWRLITFGFGTGADLSNNTAPE